MRGYTKNYEHDKWVALHDQWGRLTYKPVDGRWTMETLQRKIISLAWVAADKENRSRHAAIVRHHDSNERAARSALRGSMKEFASIPDCYSTDDCRVHQASIWAQQVLDKHSDLADKLADDYKDDPRDAMRWSDQYFKHAGKWTVAQKFKSLFDEGRSEAFMLAKVTDAIMHWATRINSSASCSTNYSNQMELVAWAKLKKYLDGSRIFV